MKKYDSYKDSGIEWIGEIPSHWDSSRYRYFYFSNMGVTLLKEDVKEDGIYPVYSATETDVLFGYVDEATIILNEGDIVIPARGNSIGHIKVVTSPSTSTQTTIYSKKISQNIETNFVKYFLQGLREHLFQFDRTAIPQITVNQVKNNPLVIPPPQEQTAIANFLDLKTSEIDVIIADKKRLLELYEEEKTAIINQAVTKGLDPNAPMKDSGIEWLGEIPEHWEVKKIKHLLKKKKGALKTGPFGSQLKNSDLDSSGEFKVYTQRNVLDNDFIEGNDKINEVKFQTLKEFLIEEGDILFTSRGTIGVCNVFPADSEPGILHPCLIRIQIDRGRVHQDWIINYVNNSSLFIDNVKYESNATTIEVIYGGTLKETALPVPPIQEQQSIVQYIESECSHIDFKKARTEELIELLTEYRTALISEAVTGKIKVTED